MIRKQQKRAARGKETAFRVNGQNVDPKRIARFVRRYGNSWDQDKDQEKDRDAEEQSPEPSALTLVLFYDVDVDDGLLIMMTRNPI